MSPSPTPDFPTWILFEEVAAIIPAVSKRPLKYFTLQATGNWTCRVKIILLLAEENASETAGKTPRIFVPWARNPKLLLMRINFCAVEYFLTGSGCDEELRIFS